ncbi:MAG TPA: acetylxylan esterase [Verrucomicrobiae bacterium]|nr:acetylxylan esterase [Verrucomicrobiae bacterium]
MKTFPAAILLGVGALTFLHVALSAAEVRSVSTNTVSVTNALPRTDAAGNPIRRAPTGHVSNYDEARVGEYTLPDPLLLRDGTRVSDAATWVNRRRPEILGLYQTEIYGRVPQSVPRITWEVAETNATALNGSAVYRKVAGHFGTNTVTLHIVLPAKAAQPVPVFLHLTFFGASPIPSGVTNDSGARPRFNETGPISEIVSRGFGYATLRYTDFEGDSRAGSLSRVRKMALATTQTEPAADEWGTISVWAWGASRVLDYLSADRGIDAQRIGLIGHSRLGKTVLWAGAQDPRFALVFSSCSGEMGASLARRDFGETVDDMAANFGWQFAGNFQKYVGRWNEMPVDSHLLISLIAPRPVFITGGTQDQWADPRGQFLAAVAAEPVYRLLGKTGLGVKELPDLDQPVVNGSVGFLYHTGGHTITAEDWKTFLDFADRNLVMARGGETAR